jgi:peptidoglycan/xylan/chitin deacetylase (PgdA/CDA1 family)
LAQIVPVLVYHSIDGNVSERYRKWAIPPQILDRHLELIRANNFSPISVSAFTSAKGAGGMLPQRPVVLTFDDGLRDFLTGAMPVLSKYLYPATLFVVSGLVGQKSLWLRALGEEGRAMLSWSELREIVSAGIECGAHSLSHPELDVISAPCADKEIRMSKVLLEDHLGCSIQSFAYPHGYSSPATRRLVERAGYSSACRVRHALSTVDENAFGLSRIIMTTDISDEQLLKFLNGQDLPVTPPLERLLSYGWRLTRRAKLLRLPGSGPVVSEKFDVAP